MNKKENGTGGKEVTRAGLGNDLRAIKGLWLSSLSMEQRNDTSDLRLKGSIWTFIENRQMRTRKQAGGPQRR